MYRYENTGSVYRRPPIPRQGSSPDFVHRGTALPSFPVDCKAAPVHSDCIVPDSHRILYSPSCGGTSAIQFYIFSDISIISSRHIFVNAEDAPLPRPRFFGQFVTFAQKISAFTNFILLLPTFFYNVVDRTGGTAMYVTYNNLFKLLIDKGLNKTEFAREVGISSNTLAKLS